MKSIMGINEEWLKPDLSPEYLLKRIPFLSSFKNLSNDQRIRFDKTVENTNAQFVIKDNIYTFENVTTSSEFYYSIEQMDAQRYRFVFKLTNRYWFRPPTYNDKNEQLAFITFIQAMKQMEDKLSYDFDQVTNSNVLPEETVNSIINNINKAFFEFESYTEDQLHLKNPLNEDVSPQEVNTNKTAVESIIQKKRNIGTVFFDINNKEEYNHIINQVNQNPDLNTIHVDSNPYKLYIIYRVGHEHDAQELKKLYDENGGFISPQAPDQVQRREGELLGYRKGYIDHFIANKREPKSLKEYVTNDMVYLKDYLNLTEDQKAASIVHEFSYLFNDFLEEENIEFQTPTHDYTDVDGDQTGDPYDDYEIMDWLSQNNPELLKAYGHWLLEKIERNELGVPDAEYPAWSFYDYRGIVKNQWLIHFTGDAQGIASAGFTQGVSDMTKLGLTTQLSEFEKKYGGYNFAFLISDFKRYAGNGYTRGGGYKYGNEAVVFNASGIKVWHHGDEEPQIIFFGNTAKNIIPIEQGDHSKYSIRSNKTREILFESDELETVVDWLTKHYQQYRKHLA